MDKKTLTKIAGELQPYEDARAIAWNRLVLALDAGAADELVELLGAVEQAERNLNEAIEPYVDDIGRATNNSKANVRVAFGPTPGGSVWFDGKPATALNMLMNEGCWK